MKTARAARRRRWQGFTLVELMTGLALGLLVSALAASSFHAVQVAYRTAVDLVLLEERGQHALAIIAQLIRHGGWRPDAAAMPAQAPPAVSGRDDCGQPGIGPVPACARRGVNGGDALLVRFSGSGRERQPALPDRTMVDCSGYALAARSVGDAAKETPYAGANLLYVASGADGEPQLLCRYASRRDGQAQAGSWTSGALVRGVETMRLRYGIDTTGDGRPDTFLRAEEMNRRGMPAWHNVLAVQVALVLRGERPLAQRARAPALVLFPPAPAAQDGAVAFEPADRPALLRRVFTASVRLRNPAPCAETLC
ncbi:PilW family protein [Cupriavidus basilensis]|uniref:PilW family protein n=1 Tax=Cupriavidus basilensis TaxID=68895 RepID=UPI000751A8C5|nr:PilW family protein [Cupriavidus basilensis]